MLNNHEKRSQPQESLLPPRLPARGRELGDLIRAVCEDRTYSPSERAQTLRVIWDQISEQQPKLKGPIFISTIAHRIAKLSQEDPHILKAPHVQDLMNEVAQEAILQCPKFNPQDLANTAWAFATLGIKNDPLFGALAQEASKQVSHFIPQALANAAWAFATLGIKNDQLFSALAQEASKQISLFNPQALANTAWAFATLGIKNDPLFGALAQEAAKQISHFNPQGLANTAWAFATIGIKNQQLFGGLAQEATKQISHFTPQALGNTAWAFATLGIKNDRLFGALSQEATKQVAHFNPQNLSNTAWAFATLGIKNDPLFGALAQEAAKQIAHFNPQALANTAWAFATLGIKNDRLFGALAQEATKQISRFNQHALANTAWAFAAIGIKNDRLFNALAQEATKHISHFNPQDLANTAWAFAVDFPKLVSSVADRTLLEQEGRLNAMEWLQCYQALLAARKVGPSESFPIYQRLVEGYQPESQNGFERSVEGALREVLKGTPSSLSQAPIIAGIATDLVVHIGDRRIIIECDGDRFHLSTGPDGGTFLGRDRLQDRLFEVFGYEVVHIRDSEWALHDHLALLRGKLGL
jgi:hypothetical protein